MGKRFFLYSIWLFAISLLIVQISLGGYFSWDVGRLAEKGIQVLLNGAIISLLIFAVSGALFHFVVTQKKNFFLLGGAFFCISFLEVFVFFLVEKWISLGIPYQEQITFAIWFSLFLQKIFLFLGGLWFCFCGKETSTKVCCTTFAVFMFAFLGFTMYFGIYQNYFLFLYQKISPLPGIYFSSTLFFLLFLLPALVRLFFSEKSYFFLSVFLFFIPQLIGENTFFYFAGKNFDQALALFFLLVLVSTIPLILGITLDNFYLFRQQQRIEAFSVRESEGKTRFINALTHEILNPLNAVMAYNQLLSEGLEGDLNAVQKDTMGKSMKACERLQNLVEELSTLSKAEQGKLGYNLEKLDIRKEWEASLPVLQEMGKKREIEVQLQGESKSFMIKADKRRFSQVVLNLFLYLFHFFEKTQILIEIKEAQSLFTVLVKGKKLSQIESVDLSSINRFALLFSEVNVRPFLWISLCEKLFKEQGGELIVKQEKEGLCFYGKLQKV